MEPELISARGRDMATCFSGEAVGVDLLMRNGCTWRTILSVWRWCRWVVLVEAEGCLVTRGADTVVLSIVLRRQTGRGCCCGMRAWACVGHNGACVFDQCSSEWTMIIA